MKRLEIDAAASGWPTGFASQPPCEQHARVTICYNILQEVPPKGGINSATLARQSMVQMTIDIPEEALGALRKAPQDFAKELRLAAAVKWYELRLLSQERAARVAGVSRAEFLDVLGRFGVSPFQYGPDEIVEEADRE